MADRTPGLWYARHLPSGVPGAPAPVVHTVVLSGQFPAGSTVELPDDRPPAGWRSCTRTGADGVVRSVLVAPPVGPLTWYLEVPGPDASTLVAFSDPRFGEGTVLSAEQYAHAGVRAEQQVGALRWWPASGLVHQLYVQPAARRSGIGLKLTRVAFGLQSARGLPMMHGDGRHTDDGAAWVAAAPAHVAARVAPRTHVMAPMTPPG